MAAGCKEAHFALAAGGHEPWPMNHERRHCEKEVKAARDEAPRIRFSRCLVDDLKVAAFAVATDEISITGTMCHCAAGT